MPRKEPHRAASRGPGILERLAKGVVLGDGGYLLELEKRGYVQAGPFTPEVVLEHPFAVKELHQEFLDAGAEVLQSLAFYASKEKLATTGFADRVGEINRAAVRLAREVAEDRALVAANLSLTWMYDPKDGASSDKVRTLFDEQLNAQLREAPDFVIAETFSWLGEALLAAERIEKTGLPSMVTMSFDKNPMSYDGRTPGECARPAESPGQPGLACGRQRADVRVRVLPARHRMREPTSGSDTRFIPLLRGMSRTILMSVGLARVSGTGSRRRSRTGCSRSRSSRNSGSAS